MKDDKIINYIKKKKTSFKNYIKLIFSNFNELRGDRNTKDDRSIIGGIAKLEEKSIMIIGQEKGKNKIEKEYHNYGMTSPEGFRKALRLFKMAEKFKLPIITFIDTPGAAPSKEAEINGQSIAIGTNLKEMFLIKTPIISIIIGEGCSGGALGISVCDKLLMNKKSYLSVINPEGCASILSIKRNINILIEKMNITPEKLKNLKIIDEIIDEKKQIKKQIKKHIEELEKIPINLLLKKREKKFKKIGIL